MNFLPAACTLYLKALFQIFHFNSHATVVINVKFQLEQIHRVKGMVYRSLQQHSVNCKMCHLKNMCDLKQ
jgi:hypothetical protein